MTTNNEQRTTNKIIWIVFAVLIIFVYFFGLNMPLVGPDEPRYAQVAREMFERGDWITPTLGGFTWFEKPALLYWLEIASYKIFGVTEFAARFGSAIFGLGTILSLWILGKFSATEFTEKHRENKDKEKNSVFSVNSVAKKDFANWLALIAASSIGLISFSRGASFDIILTFPITASLVCYFLFEVFLQNLYFSQNPKFVSVKLPKSTLIFSSNLKVFYPYFFLAGFYFFIGVALIGKGLIGIVFPLAIVFFYHILKFELLPGKVFLISLLWGTIFSLLVASVWYLPVYQANGWKFVDEFIIQHHFQRYTSNKYQHPQPFWFFWVVLPLMTVPWLPFFFISIYKTVRSYFSFVKEKFTTQNSALGTQYSALTAFAVAWLLVPLVFFSLSGSKLPGYILPALPAALILTAQFVYRFIQNSARRKIGLQILAFLMFVFVIVALQFFAYDFVKSETVHHLVETANSEGYKNEKILNLHTISHSVEFYGAGRLVRQQDGKQKRFYGTAEIVEQMRKDNVKESLVLIPLDYLKDLTESDLVETRILDDNGELAICAVKIKGN